MPFFFCSSYGIIILIMKKRFARERDVGLLDRDKILCKKGELITSLGMIDCGRGGSRTLDHPSV